MRRRRGIPMSKVNPNTMLGPGDFDPPEEPEAYAECEGCGEEFCYNPEDYTASDGETIDHYTPNFCERCSEKEAKSIPLNWEQWAEEIQNNEPLQEEVDVLVHDMKSKEASAINNSGASDQIAYLREAIGDSLEEELIETLEACQEGSDDGDKGSQT